MAKTATMPKAKPSARKKPAARQAARRRSVKAAKPRRPKQVFVASHLKEGDFEEGLRSYAKYRDLGIAEATGGLARAHVIRMVPPCIPEVVSKRHYHDVEFQMIYVLKGSLTSSFEGQGTHTMKAGDAWLQPHSIKHKVLDYSPDCEVLEIVLPANFKTVELEK